MPSLAILISAVLVLLCRETDRQTEQQNHIQTTQADDRYTHATAVGVSKNAAVADELGRTARILASF